MQPSSRPWRPGLLVGNCNLEDVRPEFSAQHGGMAMKCRAVFTIIICLFFKGGGGGEKTPVLRTKLAVLLDH